MGQKISTNGIQSTHKVNDIDLHFKINGPIQENATGRTMDVVIKGSLYKDSQKLTSISDQIKQDFIKFVPSDQFQTYIKDKLFKRVTSFERDFPYTLPQSTLDNMTWELSSKPSASFDKSVFTINLRFKLSDPTNEQNTLRSCVIFMSKNFINALEEKRAESMPIKDKDGKNLRFGPDQIAFQLEK